MKKIVSIILAALMLCALCAPAFAEDEPTEVVPKERGDYKAIGITDAGNYIIKKDYEIDNLDVGLPDTKDVTLTIPKGVTVTVTSGFNNHGTINMCGTLIISDSARSKSNKGTINIMGCCCGKLEGTLNKPGTVNTYDEHNFENDKCTYCGTYECEITGKHTFVDGKCVCGTYECMGTAKHNWVNGVCSVCNTPCDHKWDANTGKCTVCEYECRHNDGYTAGKCNICQQECKHGNTFTKTFCSDCGEEVKSTTPAVGSALSEGSLTIISCVACLAVGFLAAMFIFKKKKPALAGGAENTDEE